MADPVSILGLISASLTITIRAATIGKDLHSLIAKYKTTNTRVRQLSVHVAAVRVAARSLSSWLEEDAVGSEEVEDVKSELLEVLSACCGLLSDLQDHVAKALAGAESVGFKGVISYIWDEDIIKETMETLHHQETALVLILQTLGQLTRKQQRVKMQEQAVVQTLERAKRPSSSIFGIRSDDQSSMRFSYISENSERMSAVFTFDMEVMSSSAYRNAFTSLLKRNITSRREDRNSAVTITPIVLEDEAQSPNNDVIGQAISTEHKMDPVSDFRAPPRILPPVMDVNPGEIVDMTSDKMNQENGFNKARQVRPPGSLSPSRKPRAAPRPKSPPPASAVAAAEGLYWRAMYDYDADDRVTLSFRQGDILHVITLLESGWHDGVINGVRGWFPSNYGIFVDRQRIEDE